MLQPVKGPLKANGVRELRTVPDASLISCTLASNKDTYEITLEGWFGKVTFRIIEKAGAQIKVL